VTDDLTLDLYCALRAAASRSSTARQKLRDLARRWDLRVLDAAMKREEARG
jgi:hypothetical protein